MAKYRNTLTGVVVDVDDATAALLGGHYEPVKGKSDPEPKRSTRKK